MSRNRGGQDVHILLASFGNVQTLECDTDWVSSCYGAKAKAPVCRVRGSGTGRLDIVTMLVPTRSVVDIQIGEIRASGGTAVEINLPGGRDVVAVRSGDILSVNGLTTDAEVSWVRRDVTNDQIQAAAMLNGRSMRVGGIQLSSPTVSCVEHRRTAQTD